MDSNKTRYIVVGGVLWAALIILIGGMLFLNERDPRQRTATYYAMFDQVSSLGSGDPVRVNGVKVGKIGRVGLADRRVRVELEVLDSVKIPANSEVRVQNVGILGERQIGIRLGDSPEILKPGAVVDGSFDAGISEVMGAAGEIFDSTRVLLSEVRAVVDSTVGSESFRDGFRRIVSQAERLENRLDGMIDEKLLADAGALAVDAQALMARADELAGRLETMLARLESKDNTVGVLLNDDAFYKDLTRTMNSADSLLRSVLRDGLDLNIDFF